MANNTRTAFYACLLLLAIIVGACVKDGAIEKIGGERKFKHKF